MNQPILKLTFRRIVTLLTVGLYINYPAFAQISNEDSVQYSKELIGIEQTLMNAIPSGDTMLWDHYLDDRFFIVTEDGTRLSRAEFIASMEPMPKGYSGWIKIKDA